MQAAPRTRRGRRPDRLAAVPGVCDVHDLHVWTLTSGMDVVSAHLSLEPAAELGTVLATAREALHEDFAIDHATLQVEPPSREWSCPGGSSCVWVGPSATPVRAAH